MIGCFDHVPPPAAVPPDPGAPAGQLGFKYDRLGVRVPTIFISAWIEAGTVVNTPLQHCSIIRTICEKWGLPHLTERDLSAPHIGDIFTGSEVRNREDWPDPTPRPNPSEGSNRHHPLNRLQWCIAKTLGHLVDDVTPELETVDHALTFLKGSLGKLRKLV